jgi:hypothetical protein
MAEYRYPLTRLDVRRWKNVENPGKVTVMWQQRSRSATPPRQRVDVWTATILGLCVGLGLMLCGAVIAKCHHDYYADADVAEGTVTSVNYGPHHVTVQYTNADGKTVSFPDNTWFGRELGERVPVKYFAHDNVPSATSSDFNGMYGTAFGLACVGLLSMLGGITCLAVLRRRARRGALEGAELPESAPPDSARASTPPREDEHAGAPAVEPPVRRGRWW